MAISDLTGTKWYMNDTINGTSLFTKSTWNISGQCDSYEGETWYGSYTAITTETDKRPSTYYLINLTGYGLWYDGASLSALTLDAPGVVMRYISITGGTDATNSTLIAWFEANGTQILSSSPQTLATILYSINTPPYALVPVNIVQKKSISSGSGITNLTGTTWVCESSSININISTNFAINFISDDSNFSYFCVRDDAFALFYRFSSDDIPGTYAYISQLPPPGMSVGWQKEEYKTIQITGGTDATNPTLISWLQSEATFVSGDSFQPVLASHIGTSVVTIQFRIGSVIYQAEEDMTWYEWVNSDYNTGGYTCPNASQYIHSTNLSNYMVGKGSNYIRSNYIITPNCAYTLIGRGAGN